MRFSGPPARSGWSGVRRLVHVGTVYPSGGPRRDTVDESRPRNPHTFKGPGPVTIRRFAELAFAAAGTPVKLRAVNKTMLRLLPGLAKASYEDGIRATVQAMRGAAGA